MQGKNCIAMLLAGGQGSRLGLLTKDTAKPAVPFGGKYRIIDLTLSNCTNSGIDTVGVLTQYQPLELNAYIGTGLAWDLDRIHGGVSVLPPYHRGDTGEWYKGTANAIYQNMEFVDRYRPENVLVLSGDHIYKMDYSWMLKEHYDNDSDVTIAVIQVPMEDASRFGIMDFDEDKRIVSFEEKPEEPRSNMASMGVYMFKWGVLKEYLLRDEHNPSSTNDFGKDIIPAMLNDKLRLFAHPFDAYWKDVGTIRSLWEANMDLISQPPVLALDDTNWRIYSRNPNLPPHYIGSGASILNSLVPQGCVIHGTVENCVLSSGVYIGRDAYCKDSFIMPHARIEDGALVRRAILAEHSGVGRSSIIGDDPILTGAETEADANDGISVLGKGVHTPPLSRFPRGSYIGPLEAYSAVNQGMIGGISL